jgi:hypothetical protein
LIKLLSNLLSIQTMLNKGILIFFLMIGIILVVIQISSTQQACPHQKIIYRYIPRTFEEDAMEPVYPSDIFKAMFTQPSAWNNGINDFEQRRNLDINNYFISQM